MLTGMEHLLKNYDALGTSDKITIAIGFVSIIIGIIAAIAGALFGSLSAYYLARNQQKRDLEDKRYSALVATQYALLYQRRTLDDMYSAHLEKCEKHPMRYIEMPSNIIIVPHFAVPLSDITFIAEANKPSKTADVLQKIHIAEENFLVLVESFKIVMREKETVLNDERLILGFDESTDQYLMANNPAGFVKLKEATNLLYAQYKVSVPPIEEAIRLLGLYIQERFPRRLALGVALPDGTTLYGAKPL